MGQDYSRRLAGALRFVVERRAPENRVAAANHRVFVLSSTTCHDISWIDWRLATRDSRLATRDSRLATRVLRRVWVADPGSIRSRWAAAAAALLGGRRLLDLQPRRRCRENWRRFVFVSASSLRVRHRAASAVIGQARAPCFARSVVVLAVRYSSSGRRTVGLAPSALASCRLFFELSS
jgi:hypothetical protein